MQPLNALAVSKLSSVPGTTTRVTARADLRDRLEAISQPTRIITEQSPGMEEKFSWPNRKAAPGTPWSIVAARYRSPP